MAINVDGDSNDAVEIGYGGTGSQLTDPGADRILFWDDSAAAGSNMTWLAPGTGLSITATTLNVTWPIAFTSGYSSDFDAAVVAIGATPTTLYVDDATTMSTNVATPATLTTIVLNGGSIATGGNALTTNGLLIMQGGTIDGASTLTINGPLQAGRYQIFGASITVDGTPQMDVIYPEWWGAVPDGLTDCYDAISRAIVFVGPSGIGGGEISFGRGTYIVGTTLRIVPVSDGVTDYNNIAFSGLGPGSPQSWDNATILKYTGAGEYGLFDLVSVQGIHFRDLKMELGIAKTNLIRIGAENTTQYSSWHVTFDRVGFGGSAAFKPTGALLHAYNTLQLRISDSYFQYGATSMILGENYADQDGLAGGYIGRAVFENILFTGDIEFRRAINIIFEGCQFAENTGATPAVDPMIITTAGDKDTHGVSFLGCDFYGRYGDATPTKTAVDLEDVEGLVVSGCSMQDYLIGFDLDGAISGGVKIGGNWVNMHNGTNPIFIKVQSTFGGEIDYGYNDMSAGAITNNATLISDLRVLDAFTDTDATPSVSSGIGKHKAFKLTGTTTITDFDEGAVGQIITVLASSNITITDGTNIFLNGSANFDMVAQDTLTLLYGGNYWYETARSANGT